MSSEICPKKEVCRLINDMIPEFPGPHDKYLADYCLSGKNNWSKCKRYQTATELGECPDFLLPDTKMSLPEIIDKMDI